MSTGLVPAEWSTAFLAFALVGAVFAVGIAGALNAHLVRIVAVPGGVARSSEAVVVALGLALVGLAGSWPADTPARVGIAVAIVAAGTLCVLLATIALGGSGPGMPPRTGLRLGVALAATVPTILGGLLLALGIVPGLDPMLIGVGASAVGGLWLGAYLLLDLPRG
jgi:hypothetical protein